MTEIPNAHREDAKKLFAKLEQARESVGTVEKRGKNTGQNYSYAMAEDVLRVGLAALDEAGLLCEFEAGSSWSEKSESGSLITSVKGVVTVTDPDTAFAIHRPVLGSGADKPGDKGIFKAMTGARKYGLIHLLGIAVGDDPDEERKAAGRGGRQSSAGGQVLPQKRVDQVFKLIGVKLTPANYKGNSLPADGFKRLGVMFGSISAERPSVNRADSIKKGLRGLTGEQADQLAKLLEGEGAS
jgi:hypothetical protein